MPLCSYARSLVSIHSHTDCLHTVLLIITPSLPPHPLASRAANTTNRTNHSKPPTQPTNQPPPNRQVPDSFSVERTYILFRTMGLRHLVVVDDHCRPRGMVTRKDLLGYRLGAKMYRTHVAYDCCMHYM